MKKRTVPFYRASITSAEIQAASNVLKSGWLTTGQVCKKFEQKFNEYIGCRHSAAVNSCTAGMILALKALGIGRGDQVITTPYTFVATVEAILTVDARPVFVDIDPVTLNLDCDQIESKITARTRAILPVHIAGLPCRLDRINRIARKHGLKVVHDAAHALGASFKGKRIGAWGDISSFSFYATKNLTTAEGGMVTTDNKKFAEAVQIMSLHGMDKKAWKRYLDSGSWYYEVVKFGYKFNMPDLNAAVGLATMDRLKKLQQKRAIVAGWYDKALTKFPQIELPARDSDSEHGWHLYIIKLNLDMLEINRDKFIRELTARNIGTSVHFIPMFLHPYYKGKYGLSAGKFPHSANAYRRVISLPFYPDLTKDEMQYTADSIGEIIDKYSE